MTAAPNSASINTHAPVMLAEVLADLAPQDGARIIDGTFGRGGYSRAMLAAAACEVIAIDRDPMAVAYGNAMSAEFGGRLTVLEGRFGDMAALLRAAGHERVDGVVLDLGVSSPQIDDPARGFSFRFDGPLDMRMGSDGATAADLVNDLAERDLADLSRGLGEERHARRVAAAICAARAEGPITRTGALADIVRAAVPKSRDGLDPATRTFMALRLRVNDELGELERGLAAAEQMLAPGGRLVVVSFHSLEDRRVKRFLRSRAGVDAGASRHLPLAAPGPAPSFQLLRRPALKPGEAECRANPRARSARLRAAERTDAPAFARESEAA